LAITDIQHAADLFKGVYDEANGADGFVSLEVSPFLALDTEERLNRPQSYGRKSTVKM